MRRRTGGERKDRNRRKITERRRIIGAKNGTSRTRIKHNEQRRTGGGGELEEKMRGTKNKRKRPKEENGRRKS